MTSLYKNAIKQHFKWLFERCMGVRLQTSLFFRVCIPHRLFSSFPLHQALYPPRMPPPPATFQSLIHYWVKVVMVARVGDINLVGLKIIKPLDYNINNVISKNFCMLRKLPA